MAQPSPGVRRDAFRLRPRLPCPRVRELVFPHLKPVPRRLAQGRSRARGQGLRDRRVLRREQRHRLPDPGRLPVPADPPALRVGAAAHPRSSSFFNHALPRLRRLAPLARRLLRRDDRRGLPHRGHPRAEEDLRVEEERARASRWTTSASRTGTASRILAGVELVGLLPGDRRDRGRVGGRQDHPPEARRLAASRPTAGRVDLPAHIGFVFQDDRLLPWRTVAENTALPLVYQGYSRKSALCFAHYLLAEAGLAGEEAKKPVELSGGMKKRAALARCFARLPEAIILDEPFTGLHREARVAAVGDVRAPALAAPRARPGRHALARGDRRAPRLLPAVHPRGQAAPPLRARARRSERGRAEGDAARDHARSPRRLRIPRPRCARALAGRPRAGGFACVRGPAPATPGRLLLAAVGKAAAAMASGSARGRSAPASTRVIVVLPHGLPRGLGLQGPRRGSRSWRAATPCPTRTASPRRGGFVALVDAMDARATRSCSCSRAAARACCRCPRPAISLADKMRDHAAAPRVRAPTSARSTRCASTSARSRAAGSRRRARGRIETLAISDVVGDPLEFIASGPTVPDSTTFADALGVLARYDLAAGAVPADGRCACSRTGRGRDDPRDARSRFPVGTRLPSSPPTGIARRCRGRGGRGARVRARSC